jgi:para-nitrobenzyl esterase
MHQRIATAAAIFVLLLAPPTLAAEPPVVAVHSGKLAGEGEGDGDVAIFRGIPYAAPPVGNLRWRPPQRAASWSGVRDATKFGSSCPQWSGGGKIDILRYGGAPPPTSEDCLTLNVWAPAHAKRAAVMVWFHGGAGRIGSGSLPYYDGTSFARDGVVLVTVNYRLGHLGSFAYPGLAKEAAKSGAMVGAYGLMDQIAALQWVKRNIAAFGGDPGNVTIFGESSGGISVFDMLATPVAWPYFEKAIIESGGGWFGPPASMADAEKKGEALAAAVGLPHATLAQLRALPAQKIADAPGDSVAEPDPRLVPEDPTIAIAAGRVAQVPLLIGVNDGEDSLIDRNIAKAEAALDTDTLAKLRKVYGVDLTKEMAARLYFRDGLATAPARWVVAHWMPPAYLYRFEHVTESYRPKRKRAHHGAEIFYVFETLGREPDVASHPTPADEALARQIHARWVAFAKTGRPDTPGAPRWPAYSATSDQWMVFGQDRAHVQAHLMKPQLDWYDSRTGWLILMLRIKDAVTRFFWWL